MDDHADTVADLLDALEIGRAHILGHSFGGGLALAGFKRHPRLVRSLILVSAYAGWAGSLPPEEVEERRQRAERNARRPTQDWVDYFLATRPQGMVPMLNAFAEADLTDVLGNVTVPTLLLHGDEDQRSRRPVAESMNAAIPASRLVFVHGAGHDVHVEAPNAFDDEALSFLRRV